MVLKLQMSVFKISPSKSLILICCILTFLYLVELCLGVRNVVYVFGLFRDSQLSTGSYDDISWTVVVATLLLCVVTSITVSSISSYWASKNTTGCKSSIYYCCHIVTGGILWRYVGLFKRDSLESQKEEAMLLTNLKFLFTQTYTIPLLIIHLSLHEDPHELLYDLIMLVSIVTTLVLTCLVFNVYEPCGEYPYETMALVPLLFEKFSQNETTSQSTEKGTTQDGGNKPKEVDYLISNVAMRRTLAAVQSFCFALGRIMALGVLLKLTGVYAFTIIFLQFLLSALYLKFQASKLVPESLSKSKQLLRLAFLSYALIFDWQLYRDTGSGYSHGSKPKHRIFYYSVATVESMFYLIVWAVNESQLTDRRFMGDNDNKQTFAVALASFGCSCLVASYGIQVGIIAFGRFGDWKRSVNIHRIPAISQIAMRLNFVDRKDVCRDKPKIDISSFSDQEDEPKPKVTNLNNSISSSPEAKYGSYRDLKENINYCAEIKHVPRKTKDKAPLPMMKVIDEKQQAAPPDSKSSSCTSNKLTAKPTTNPKAKSLNILTILKDVKPVSHLLPIKSSKKESVMKKASNIQDTNKTCKQNKSGNTFTDFTSGVSAQIRKLATLDIKQIAGTQNKVTPQKIDGPITIPTIMTEYHDDGLDSEHLKTISGEVNINEYPEYGHNLDDCLDPNLETRCTEDSFSEEQEKNDTSDCPSTDRYGARWTSTRLYPPQVSIECDSDEDDVVYESSGNENSGDQDYASTIVPQVYTEEEAASREQFV